MPKGHEVHQVGSALLGEETHVICLQQFCSVVLDDQSSSHRFHVDHAFKVRSATGADSAVPSGTRLVVPFREVKEPFVEMYVIRSERYGSSVGKSWCSPESNEHR